MIDLFRVLMASDAPARVARVLQSGYIGQGPEVEAFEQALGSQLGLREPPLAMNSCTNALDLALHLVGVGPGDEVISTPVTCTATNGVIANRGAAIVWADVDPVTGNIDPYSVAIKMTPKTRAVMAVDWGGRLCDYGMLAEVAAPVPVIEDAAHAFLADGPAHGDYVAFSFQAIKHLTTGDGGALVTPAGQTERGRLLRWYGLDRRSKADFRCSQDITEIGFKYHMNDIAAAMGLANLPGAARAVGQHRENAAWYERALAGVDGIVLPPPDDGSAWWLYTLLVDDRDAFIGELAERGVAASPVHARNDRHTAFAAASESRGPLPGVDAFTSRNVAIPVGWWLSEAERAHVAESVWAAARRAVRV